MTAKGGTPKPARRRLDSLFARLLLAQAIVVTCATTLFALLVFADRSIVLAEPYAEVLAPELASVTGGTALPGPPRTIQRRTEPDAPAALRITGMPGVRALMLDLAQRGVTVDDVALETRNGVPTFWLRVRPAPTPSPAVWVGVTGPVILPTWSYRLTFGISAVLLLVGAASWAFARRVSRPLERLRTAIESQAPGRDVDANPRPSGPSEGVPEVVAIAAAYAELQLRLLRYERERSVLLGGVSHDLCIPPVVRFPADARFDGIDDALVAEVLTQADTQLRAQLGARYKLTTSPDDADAVLQVAVTRVALQPEGKTALDLIPLRLITGPIKDAALGKSLEAAATFELRLSAAGAARPWRESLYQLKGKAIGRGDDAKTRISADALKPAIERWAAALADQIAEKP